MLHTTNTVYMYIWVHRMQSTDQSHTNRITSTIVLRLWYETYFCHILWYKGSEQSAQSSNTALLEITNTANRENYYVLLTLLKYTVMKWHNRTFQTLLQQLFTMNLNPGSSFISITMLLTTVEAKPVINGPKIPRESQSIQYPIQQSLHGVCNNAQQIPAVPHVGRRYCPSAAIKFGGSNFSSAKL